VLHPTGTTADAARGTPPQPGTRQALRPWPAQVQEVPDRCRRPGPRPMRTAARHRGPERGDRRGHDRTGPRTAGASAADSVSPTGTTADAGTPLEPMTPQLRLVQTIGTKGGLFPISLRFRGGIFSGDHFTPVETDEELAHGNGRRTDKRSMAELEAQPGSARWAVGAVPPMSQAQELILSGHSLQLRAPRRKHWLSVRKEALVSSSGAAQERE
jgi:hypothetical protein